MERKKRENSLHVNFNQEYKILKTIWLLIDEKEKEKNSVILFNNLAGFRIYANKISI